MDMTRDDCSICIEPINTEDYYDTSCSHSFHKLCIVTWLVKADTCPYCRTVLEHVFENKNGKQRKICLFILLQEKKEEKCRELLKELNEGMKEILHCLGEALRTYSSLLVVKDVDPESEIEGFNDILDKWLERMTELRNLFLEHDDEITEVMETYQDSALGQYEPALRDICLELEVIGCFYESLNNTCLMAALLFKSQKCNYMTSTIRGHICEAVKIHEEDIEELMQTLRGCIVSRNLPLNLTSTTKNILFSCSRVDLCICCQEKLMKEAPNKEIDGCEHSICSECFNEDSDPDLTIRCPCQESQGIPI